MSTPPTDPADTRSPGAGPPPDAPALEVAIDGLHHAFGEHAVLRGVDLRIARGEIVAVVGGSGCGKTVLLRHMIGSLSPDEGRVRVADHESEGAPLVDLAQLDEEHMDRLRRHWAVVFQGNALFSGSVYENVALWLREVKLLEEPAIAPRVRSALEAVGLDPGRVWDLDRSDLSGGMRKRVALARAIAMQPLLLLFDEPTTGLDPVLANQIHDLICATHESESQAVPDRTTVIVTHDKDLLHRLQPRIVMLEQGRVSFDGAYRAFRASDSPGIRPYFEMMPGLHRRMQRE